MNVAALCAGAALTLLGLAWWSQSSSAHPTDSLPAGSFRVAVNNLVAADADPSVMVTQVSIETEGGAGIQVKGSNFDYGPSAGPSSQQHKSLSRAETIIVADLTTHKNKANNTFKLLLQSSGTFDTGAVARGSYHSTLSTPSAAKVSDVLTLTIQPGVYRLGTPLPLGTLQGKPITLTVR
jgi:hypothetical protein